MFIELRRNDNKETIFINTDKIVEFWSPEGENDFPPTTILLDTHTEEVSCPCRVLANKLYAKGLLID